MRAVTCQRRANVQASLQVYTDKFGVGYSILLASANFPSR